MLVTGRSVVGLGGIVGTDESSLFLAVGIFGLTECESSVPSHSLDGANLLDRLLESIGGR